MDRFTSFWEDKKKISYLIALVLFIGAVLRVYKFLISGPVSFDEAYSYWIGSKSLIKLMALAAVDKHPPLYYLFMHFWNYFFYSELWIRIPSLIASLLSLLLFVRVSRQVLKSDYLVLFAITLFALDISQIQYAAIARSYAITSFFVLLSMHSFFTLTDSKQEKFWYWINVISNLLLTLLLYTGAFVFFTQALMMLVLIWSKAERKPIAIRWFKYHILLIILFIVLIPYVYQQISIGGFAPKWIAELVGEPYREMLFLQGTLLDLNLYKIEMFEFRILVGAFIALIIFLSAILKRDSFTFTFSKNIKFWSLAIVYGLPPLVFWIVSHIEPIFVSRYFLIFYFAYYILLVYALDHLKYIRKISLIFVLFFAIGLMPLMEGVYSDEYRESDWKTKSAIIAANWQQNDLLFIIPHADGVRAKFYLKDMHKYKVDLNVYRDIFKSKKKLITDATLDSVFINWKYPYKRVWFHEEKGTGLSAEFEVVQTEGFIYHYLDSLFIRVDSLQYDDEHGILSLFEMNKKEIGLE